METSASGPGSFQHDMETFSGRLGSFQHVRKPSPAAREAFNMSGNLLRLPGKLSIGQETFLGGSGDFP